MNKRILVSLGVICFLIAAFIGGSPHVKAANVSDPAIGQIGLFSFNYVPYGWCACDGGSLPVNQADALFALIGTTFGGDGATAFNLPNLKDKSPMKGLNYCMAVQGVFGVDGVESVVGEVCLFPDKVISNGEGSKNWKLCDGSSLKVSDYQMLFALIGTTYGGDESSFNIPDLKGKSPIPGVNYYIAVNGIFPQRDGRTGVDDFVGAVTLYAFGFVPGGYCHCDGKTLPIQQNAALYSLVNVQFGGDGRTTFGVPNLAGKEPLAFMKYGLCTMGLYPPRD